MSQEPRPRAEDGYPLWTTREVADAYGLTLAGVRNRVQRGLVDFVRFPPGRSVRRTRLWIDPRSVYERQAGASAPKEWEHGTPQRYDKRGCRCEACRAAWSELQAEYRARRLAGRPGQPA